MQLQSEQHSDKKSDVIKDVVISLPPLPSLIRYYDDFDDLLITIHSPLSLPDFLIANRGAKLRIDFSRFSDDVALLAKHVFVFLLASDIQAISAAKYVLGAINLSRHHVADLLTAGPSGISNVWARLNASNLPHQTFDFCKSLLRLLCAHRLCGWSNSYNEILRSLPYPPIDKYAGIRSGDVFLSVESESAIVRYLDGIASDVNHPNDATRYSNSALADAAMIACAYQFGMRPIQIALLTLEDVRVRKETSGHSVHLKFRMVKQRNGRLAIPLVRKVKFEWSSIFVELHKRKLTLAGKPSDRFLDATSSQEVGTRITKLAGSLTSQVVTPTDLRHTAAQRMVDAGASQEEMAEFLGHTDSSTSLVYFDASANQAELVNKALGVSEIYSRVARIAHARFISTEELNLLKTEKQVAGVPHGISITGIGGCQSGQPACPFNPVMSCYGCRKFMPVNDTAVHRSVLDNLREVVRLFADASRAESRSPAYLQLRHTISEVEAVIGEIEGEAP
jgi:integrase